METRGLSETWVASEGPHILVAAPPTAASGVAHWTQSARAGELGEPNAGAQGEPRLQQRLVIELSAVPNTTAATRKLRSGGGGGSSGRDGLPTTWQDVASSGGSHVDSGRGDI